MMCHRLPAMPSRFHPQLNGSDKLWSTKVIIENTVVSAKAIQQPSPIGMRAAVVTRNWVFAMTVDLLMVTPALVSRYHTKGRTPRHTTHTAMA